MAIRNADFPDQFEFFQPLPEIPHEYQIPHIWTDATSDDAGADSESSTEAELKAAVVAARELDLPNQLIWMLDSDSAVMILQAGYSKSSRCDRQAQLFHYYRHNRDWRYKYVQGSANKADAISRNIQQDSAQNKALRKEAARSSRNYKRSIINAKRRRNIFNF